MALMGHGSIFVTKKKLLWLNEKWNCDIQIKTKILEYKTEQIMNEWMNEWMISLFILG